MIAAALAAHADMIATFDRRHLLNQAGLILHNFGIAVMNPEEILRTLPTVD